MTLSPSYFFDLSEFSHADLFQSVSFPWEVLNHIESYLKSLPLGRIEGKVSSQAYLVNPELIFIGEGTVVEPGAYIKGPCWIGKNCTIRHGAYVRGNFITGDHCILGHDSEVKNVVFLNHTHAAHFAYVGDSILGNHVNLGAGTKCANVKLDRGLVSIRYEGQRILTHLKKLGAIIGDYTQTGCNSVTNPGTLLGQGVLCFPCTSLGGFIPSRSIIKPETKLVITSY